MTKYEGRVGGGGGGATTDGYEEEGGTTGGGGGGGGGRRRGVETGGKRGVGVSEANGEYGERTAASDRRAPTRHGKMGVDGGSSDLRCVDATVTGSGLPQLGWEPIEIEGDVVAAQTETSLKQTVSRVLEPVHIRRRRAGDHAEVCEAATIAKNESGGIVTAASIVDYRNSRRSTRGCPQQRGIPSA